ncbi:hypothetical protein H0R94_02975 [Treponema socranskii]|uniref:hypothetical protein n=1 Tax=Treponema socranskii TaxID=53419 RepID=UPI003D90AFBE
MKIYSKNDLSEYMKNDWILDLLNKLEIEQEKDIRTNIWLKEMDNKRMIFSDVYGDFINNSNKKIRVLDVGGGYTSVTKELAKNIDYYLCDYMAHGSHAFLFSASKDYGFTWLNEDWFNLKLDREFDVVIANDIFPDVDQRLELFIQKVLPKCKELRLVLTWYNNPKFYVTQRIDDTEKLTFLSYNGDICSLILRKYKNLIINYDENLMNLMKSTTDSIFRNGRQIGYIIIKSNKKD